MSESWSLRSSSARILLSLVCPGGGVPFLITCLLVAVTASGLLVHPPAVQFFSAGVEAFTSKVLAFSTVPANPVGFWNIRRRAILFFFFQVDKFLLKIKPFHFFSSLLKVKMDQVLSSFTIQANHSCHLGWHNSRALPGHLHTQGRTHNFIEMELCRFFLSHFLRSAGSYGHFWKSVNIKLRRCFKQLPLSC